MYSSCTWQYTTKYFDNMGSVVYRERPTGKTPTGRSRDNQGASMGHEDQGSQRLRQRMAHARVMLLCEAARWFKRPTVAQVYEELYVELTWLEQEPHQFMVYARLVDLLPVFTIEVNTPAALTQARNDCTQVVKALIAGTSLLALGGAVEALA